MSTAHYTLIRYDEAVPTATMRIHQLLPDELRTAPPAQAVAAQLQPHLADKVLVAHSARLELAVLRKLGLRARRSQVVDTLRLTQHEQRREDHRLGIDFGLTSTARRMGIPALRPHHAFGDALTTALLFLALVGRREQRGETAMTSLLRASRPR